MHKGAFLSMDVKFVLMQKIESNVHLYECGWVHKGVRGALVDKTHKRFDQKGVVVFTNVWEVC